MRLPAAPSGRLAVRRSSSSVSSVPANGVSVSQAALVVAWAARGGGRCRGAVDGGGGAYPRSRVSQWAGQADLGQIAASDQIRAARRERAAGGRWCQAGPGRAVVPGRAASPRGVARARHRRPDRDVRGTECRCRQAAGVRAGPLAPQMSRRSCPARIAATSRSMSSGDSGRCHSLTTPRRTKPSEAGTTDVSMMPPGSTGRDT